jgi:hypothetical protein
MDEDEMVVLSEQRNVLIHILSDFSCFMAPCVYMS